MKITLNNSGQVIDERLNRAQRLIRLGLATVYIEPIKPKVKIKKIKKAEEKEEAGGKKIEDTAVAKQEYSSEPVQNW
jgi:hypothetical protein